MFIISCKYYSPVFNIAFQNWQSVFLLSPTPSRLHPKTHRGALVYRMPNGGKRISCKLLKKTLVKKEVRFRVSLLPYRNDF
jgi:hypothetical protein